MSVDAFHYTVRGGSAIIREDRVDAVSTGEQISSPFNLVHRAALHFRAPISVNLEQKTGVRICEEDTDGLKCQHVAFNVSSNGFATDDRA